MASQEELNIANGMKRDGYTDEQIGQVLARFRETSSQAEKPSIPGLISGLRKQGKSEQDINKIVSGQFGAPGGAEKLASSFGISGETVKKLKPIAREAAGGSAAMIGGITEFGGNLLQGAGKAIDYAANIPNKILGKPSFNPVQQITTPVGEFITNKGKETITGMQDALKLTTGKASSSAPAVEWVSRELVGPYLTTAGIITKLIGAIPAVKPGTNLIKTIVQKIGNFPFLANSLLTSEIHSMGSKARPSTPIELGLGVVFDIGLNAITEVAKKVAPQIFRVGVNPSHSRKDTAEEITQNATDAVNEKYWGTSWGMKKQAKDTIEESGDQLLELLKNTNKRVDPSRLFQDLYNDVLDALKAGKTSEAETMKKVIRQIKEFFPSDKALKYQDVLKAKRFFASELQKVFEAGAEADPALPALKKVWLTIWKNSDDLLNSVSPEVGALNRKMTVAYSILNPLEARLKKPFIDFSNLLTIFKELPGFPLGTSSMARGVKAFGDIAATQGAKIGARAGTSFIDLLRRR